MAGVVATQLILARNEDAAVFVTRLAAYHCGFSFEAHLFTREEREYDGFELLHRRRKPGEPPPDELLRLGIEFSDGRRAANVGSIMSGSSFAAIAIDDEAREPDPEKDISFMSGGGGGSMTHTRTDYWVWPLPPPGRLRFICEWPAYGIGESAAELGADEIREAAERARPVWNT